MNSIFGTVISKKKMEMKKEKKKEGNSIPPYLTLVSCGNSRKRRKKEKEKENSPDEGTDKFNIRARDLKENAPSPPSPTKETTLASALSSSQSAPTLIPAKLLDQHHHGQSQLQLSHPQQQQPQVQNIAKTSHKPSKKQSLSQRIILHNFIAYNILGFRRI